MTRDADGRLVPPAGMRPRGMTDRELFNRRLQLNGVDRRHWERLWNEHVERLTTQRRAKRGNR